jgi:hypothetical protein
MMIYAFRKRVIGRVALVGLDGVGAGKAGRDFLLDRTLDSGMMTQFPLRRNGHEVHCIILHLGISCSSWYNVLST